MIHPLHQSVTRCTCKESCLVDLHVSFTYVQDFVAKCYENTMYIKVLK